MGQVIRVAAALCALLSIVASAHANTVVAAPSAIRSSLAAFTQKYPHAAIIVGVVDGDSTAIYAAAGTAAKAPNDRSVYQIGSITKTFTATLLALMVQTGKVKLDDPIVRYLPPGITVPSYNEPITLLSLAEQNSGLPRLPPNFSPANDADPYADYTVDDLYQGLEQTKLTRAPGSQYEYSNFGVTLLGQLLANRMHSNYAGLVQTTILQPLGMRDTVVTGTPASRARLVPGFDTDGTSQPPWNFGTLGAAGSIESDMHDMLIYLKANMNAPRGALGAAMADAQQTRVTSGVVDSPLIGLIWNRQPSYGITWHNGETGGYHAFIGFDRATRRGIVLLANVTDKDLDLLAVHAFAP